MLRFSIKKIDQDFWLRLGASAQRDCTVSVIRVVSLEADSLQAVVLAG